MKAAPAIPLIARKLEPRPNIIALVKDILANRPLTGNERALGVQLALGAGIDGLYFGSVETMAEKIGWSKPKTERALAGLVRKQICQRVIRPLGPDGGSRSAVTIFRWSPRWREADERSVEIRLKPKPAACANSSYSVSEEPNPSHLMESLISSEKTTSLEASDPCSGIVEQPAEAPPHAWPETEEKPESATLLGKLLQRKFRGVEFDPAAIRSILRNLAAISVAPVLFVERLASKREVWLPTVELGCLRDRIQPHAGSLPASWSADSRLYAHTDLPQIRPGGGRVMPDLALMNGLPASVYCEKLPSIGRIKGEER